MFTQSKSLNLCLHENFLYLYRLFKKIKFLKYENLILPLRYDDSNIKTNLNYLKYFCLGQIYDSQKSVDDLKSSGPSKRDTFPTYVNGLLQQIQFLKEKSQNKTTIIRILTENIDSRNFTVLFH